MSDISGLKSVHSQDKLDRLLGRDYDGDPERLIRDINARINELLGTDLNRARAFLDSVAHVFGLLPDRYRAYRLAMEARLAHHGGNHREALRLYEKADRAHRKGRNYEAAARLGQGLMDVYMYVGRYDDARAVGKRSLQWFRRHGHDTHAARVMTNLGLVYHRLDRNRVALDYFDKALGIFQQQQNRLAAATVQYNRANIFANMNRLPEAAALYRRAAEVYREAGLDVFYNKAIYSIGYLHFLADRYTDALRTFETVYEAFSRLGDRKAVAVTRLDLVEMNIHLNQFSTAILHGFEIVEEFHDLGMRYEEAKASYFVALARLNLGDLDLASESLRTAERLFKKERNDLWLGMVVLARSKLHLEAGRPKSALRKAVEARGYFTRSGDRRRGTDADLVHLEALWKTGNATSARRLGRNLMRRRLVSYQAYLVHTLLGRMDLERGEHKRALESFRKAVTVTEKMLAGLYPDEIRFFFVADKLSAYSGVVQCLLALGRHEDSFLTNLRALSTLNRRRLPKETLQSQVPAKLLQEREQLRAALKRIGGFPGGSHRAAGREGYGDTEQRLWSTEQRIRARLYPARGQEAGPVFDESTMVEALEENELLISFVGPGDGPIGAFCATRDELAYVPLETDREGLRREVWELYFVIERAVMDPHAGGRHREVTEYYLKRLYRLLLEPVLRTSTAERLIFLADGIFAQVPYVALIDGAGCPLRSRHEVRLIVNPEDLQVSRRSRIRFAERSNSIFAVPSERLPAVAEEAAGIRELFAEAGFYAGDDADGAAFKEELSRCDGFIHIATHASRSAENPLFSRVVLADGPFFPFDLFATGITAQLVTLSGCQTAAAGLYYGNSFSLAKAFYQAGSRFALASLWPVSDEVSKLFMVEFYRRLRESEDIAGAYQGAVDAMAEQTTSPAHFSSFVLLGL